MKNNTHIVERINTSNLKDQWDFFKIKDPILFAQNRIEKLREETGEMFCFFVTTTQITSYTGILEVYKIYQESKDKGITPITIAIYPAPKQKKEECLHKFIGSGAIPSIPTFSPQHATSITDETDHPGEPPSVT